MTKRLDRRGFLRAVGLGAVGMAFDPERLLWVPGRKTIFLPPRRVITIEEILRRHHDEIVRKITADLERHFLHGTSPPMAVPPRGLTMTLPLSRYVVRHEQEPQG